ncbi:MAG: hypothetical protein M1813_002043 [Trichoglossum hirsutum]|nr:MAG: hypothetical protein M1813_002043 [Trichoglossum hirsutum]
MEDIKTYLPCCRGYWGCHHYPPGIYTSSPTGNDEGSPKTLKSRSDIINPLSKLAEFITHRKAKAAGSPSVGRAINCTILSLPVELLQQIEGYLSLSSAAAFAFSSRYICHAIGQQSWIKLREMENKADKVAFLSRFHKDQDHWFCEICVKLHPRNFDRSQYYENYDGFTYPFGYQLPSGLVKLAIERQEKGPPHGICPDRLSCAGIFKKHGLQLYYAYRVRVVGGELILRMDVWARPRKAGHHVPSPDLCSHQGYKSERTWAQKESLLLGRTHHYKADYPYVPQDPNNRENPIAPRPYLLNGINSREPSYLCKYCLRTTTNMGLWGEQGESLARSYQNVGSGDRDDPRWVRSISRKLPCLLSLETANQTFRILFETGVPRSIPAGIDPHRAPNVPS